MNIATALNRKYLEYTVVMLCSLCENNNEHIDAYLLHSELTTQDIDIIKNSLSKYDITIISVEINKSVLMTGFQEIHNGALKLIIDLC